MFLKDKKALTLIESLISIFLLSILLVGLLGAFYVSRLGTLRAKHRMAAMNKIKEYMEQEIKDGYLGGYVDGDFYVTAASAATVPVTIDDRGTTADTSDDLIGTIRPSPYPATILTIGTVSYKIVGFVVEWDDDVFGVGLGPACKESSVSYVCEHS